MSWHRQRRAALLQPIETERFLLRPVGRWRGLLLERATEDDPEIRQQLFHTLQRRSWRQCYRHGRLPNGRSRFTHEILVKATGQSIGQHKIQLVPHRSAALMVAIMDRAWWGKGVPLEARMAIMAHFVRHAGIERFTGFVEARNFASIANYRKLGFRHAGIMHNYGFDETAKRPVDYLYFELLKRDFPAYLQEARA
jgi:RimJ/RimL family protein N-acetyltransferase